MACLDNIQIVQTVTYSALPNTIDGFLLGQINVKILNTGVLPVIGTISVDKTRELPFIALDDPFIEQMDVITSANETFVYNFYYPISDPDSITINATVVVQIDNCLYSSSCNHVLLAPNPTSEKSKCTVDVQGYDIVEGCTNPLYLEYNPKANVDNGTCSILVPILGCTNPLATNYNPNATHNNGTCFFPSGCTNPIANNYNPKAVIEDGSCKCDDINIELDFFNSSGETFALTGDCDYFVEFDLITKIDCEKFIRYFENDTRTVLDILNSLKINFQAFQLLDKNKNPFEYYGGELITTGDTEYQLVQNENIYKFDINNKPVGIGVQGSDDNCETFFDLIATELGLECQDYDKKNFEVKWSDYKIGINSDLINTFTKLVLNYENFRFGICTLIDNLKISKVCRDKYTKCTFIPSVFGFQLDRVKDNKKAWVETDTKTQRLYDALPERDTNYLDYDSRLIFNTKELQLEVNPMKYIQNDVINYYDTFGNFYKDIDTRLLNMTTEKIHSEFIDVKNRQTIRSYSFLPYIYAQYLDSMECAISKGLHYSYGLEIIDKIGKLWFKIIEQLVPTTTIWSGNEYVLKNNIFDIQKYRYKRYSLESGTGGGSDNCAPSGVTLSCEKISSACFNESYENIDDLFILNISGTNCDISGNSVCYSEFQGDGSFSGKIIQYTENSGDTIDIIDLFGYQNYNCSTGDPIPDPEPDDVYGCTNPLAINYNPLATVDDGSCIICPEIVNGCTYIGATNYNPLANFDDGSCLFDTGDIPIICTEEADDFTCEIKYLYTEDAPNLHSFSLDFSGIYGGGIVGSWSISGMNYSKPIQNNFDYQNYKQSPSSILIPVILTNYVEFGFNQYTPVNFSPGLALTDPSATEWNDSPFFISIDENLNLPLFISGLDITINIQFVTDSGCVFKGVLLMTLGVSPNIPITTNITLTKVS